MPGGQHAVPLTDPSEIELWNALLAHQNKDFTTSGRGKRPGTQFSYTIRGAEMFISTRSKSITRATILYAFHKVRGMNGEVKGPKSIGVHGDSYIFAVFKELGVINHTTPGRDDVLDSHDKIEVQKTAKEATPMPRPKGSKNKKAITTEIMETVESIDERIAAAEAAIETLAADLRSKKAELKELIKLKAEAERVAAEKKAEEDKKAILDAVEKSGKSVEEILELLK